MAQKTAPLDFKGAEITLNVAFLKPGVRQEGGGQCRIVAFRKTKMRHQVRHLFFSKINGLTT